MKKASPASLKTPYAALKALLFVLAILLLPLLHTVPASLASSPSGAVEVDRILAIVNGEVITLSELYAEMSSRFSASLKALPEAKRVDFLEASRSEFLTSMIDVRLQLQEARKLGIKVLDKDIDMAMAAIKKTNSLSDEQFDKALHEEGFTPVAYRKMLFVDITMGRAVNMAVAGTISVSDSEVDAFLELKPSEEGEHVRVLQIFLKRPETDEAMEAFKAKVARLQAMIEGGEDFRALASRYSEDYSAEFGGDLGLVEKAALAPEFQKALSTLEPGDVSGPFKTSGGIHIVKLLERRDSGMTRGDVRALIFDARLKKEHKAWIKRLKNKSYIDIRL